MQVTQQQPEQAKAWYRLGQAQAALGQLQQAQASVAQVGAGAAWQHGASIQHSALRWRCVSRPATCQVMTPASYIADCMWL
jgi:hypothetical protein